MLIALLVLQSIVLLALLALFLRKPAAAEPDPRLAQLPDQLSRLIADEARHTREDNATSATALRNEVIRTIATLGQSLKDDLKSFREDNVASADKLRSDVEQKMLTISQGFSDFRNEMGLKHSSLEESLVGAAQPPTRATSTRVRPTMTARGRRRATRFQPPAYNQLAIAIMVPVFPVRTRVASAAGIPRRPPLFSRENSISHPGNYGTRAPTGR